MEAWRLKIETWGIRRPVVADLNHFDEDPDPEPHFVRVLVVVLPMAPLEPLSKCICSVFLSTCPLHLSEHLGPDPDLHQCDRIRNPNDNFGQL
jgi:hypothetical protein